VRLFGVLEIYGCSSETSKLAQAIASQKALFVLISSVRTADLENVTYFIVSLQKFDVFSQATVTNPLITAEATRSGYDPGIRFS